jgi:hypothetical protein
LYRALRDCAPSSALGKRIWELARTPAVQRSLRVPREPATPLVYALRFAQLADATQAERVMHIAAQPSPDAALDTLGELLLETAVAPPPPAGERKRRAEVPPGAEGLVCPRPLRAEQPARVRAAAQRLRASHVAYVGPASATNAAWVYALSSATHEYVVAECLADAVEEIAATFAPGPDALARLDHVFAPFGPGAVARLEEVYTRTRQKQKTDARKRLTDALRKVARPETRTLLRGALQRVVELRAQREHVLEPSAEEEEARARLGAALGALENASVRERLAGAFEVFEIAEAPEQIGRAELLELFEVQAQAEQLGDVALRPMRHLVRWAQIVRSEGSVPRDVRVLALDALPTRPAAWARHFPRTQAFLLDPARWTADERALLLAGALSAPHATRVVTTSSLALLQPVAVLREATTGAVYDLLPDFDVLEPEPPGHDAAWSLARYFDYWLQHASPLASDELERASWRVVDTEALPAGEFDATEQRLQRTLFAARRNAGEFREVFNGHPRTFVRAVRAGRPWRYAFSDLLDPARIATLNFQDTSPADWLDMLELDLLRTYVPGTLADALLAGGLRTLESALEEAIELDWKDEWDERHGGEPARMRARLEEWSLRTSAYAEGLALENEWPAAEPAAAAFPWRGRAPADDPDYFWDELVDHWRSRMPEAGLDGVEARVRERYVATLRDYSSLRKGAETFRRTVNAYGAWTSEFDRRYGAQLLHPAEALLHRVFREAMATSEDYRDVWGGLERAAQLDAAFAADPARRAVFRTAL